MASLTVLRLVVKQTSSSSSTKHLKVQAKNSFPFCPLRSYRTGILESSTTRLSPVKSWSLRETYKAISEDPRTVEAVQFVKDKKAINDALYSFTKLIKGWGRVWGVLVMVVVHSAWIGNCISALLKQICGEKRIDTAKEVGCGVGETKVDSRMFNIGVASQGEGLGGRGGEAAGEKREAASEEVFHFEIVIRSPRPNSEVHVRTSCDYSSK